MASATTLGIGRRASDEWGITGGNRGIKIIKLKGMEYKIMKLVAEDLKKMVREVEQTEGVGWVEMGDLPDGRKLCFVVGWGEGYEKGDGEIQKEVCDRIFTVCGKLAVNVSDLQCDYDMDWYMPSNKNGDVYDTDEAYDEENLSWWESEAEKIIELFKNGELQV